MEETGVEFNARDFVEALERIGQTMDEETETNDAERSRLNFAKSEKCTV